MKDGLKKNQKPTEILFDETSTIIRIYMHNTDLKKGSYLSGPPPHTVMSEGNFKPLCNAKHH